MSDPLNVTYDATHRLTMPANGRETRDAGNADIHIVTNLSESASERTYRSRPTATSAAKSPSAGVGSLAR